MHVILSTTWAAVLLLEDAEGGRCIDPVAGQFVALFSISQHTVKERHEHREQHLV